MLERTREACARSSMWIGGSGGGSARRMGRSRSEAAMASVKCEEA
jgi:hypothetical protein